MTAFKYDVAFSFLAQDEAIAMQLNDRLQDRVKTFIYGERQKGRRSRLRGSASMPIR